MGRAARPGGALAGRGAQAPTSERRSSSQRSVLPRQDSREGVRTGRTTGSDLRARHHVRPAARRPSVSCVGWEVPPLGGAHGRARPRARVRPAPPPHLRLQLVPCRGDRLERTGVTPPRLRLSTCPPYTAAHRVCVRPCQLDSKATQRQASTPHVSPLATSRLCRGLAGLADSPQEELPARLRYGRTDDGETVRLRVRHDARDLAGVAERVGIGVELPRDPHPE